ncbi:MAG: Fe-S protein assembly co-chaperone HscB [Azoarcus sp.]|jgi:molecular chaperone HscB|nr:Fe-S protein assembly co-chaperone HscB [Azoarcus sp.]
MNVNISLDYFTLFGLPRRFGIDEAALDLAWHVLQAEVHPDRHTHLPDNERSRMMQEALRVNEAFATLKKPLARAQYLLELLGVDTGAAANTTMAPEFLIEQMEWREAVEEARIASDVDALEQLALRLRLHASEVTATLEEQLDGGGDPGAAADTVRRLMFLDRLRRETDDALSALDG